MLMVLQEQDKVRELLPYMALVGLAEQPQMVLAAVAAEAAH